MIKPAGQNESKLFPLCVHESIKAHVNTSQFLERDWNLDRLINLGLINQCSTPNWTLSFFELDKQQN